MHLSPLTADNTKHTELLLDFVSDARDIVNLATVSQKSQAQRALMKAYTKELSVDHDSSGSSDYDEAAEDGQAAGFQAHRGNIANRRHSSIRRKVLMPGVSQGTHLGRLSEAKINPNAPSRDIFARGPGAVFFPEEDSWKAPTIGSGDILARNTGAPHPSAPDPLAAPRMSAPDLFAQRGGALPPGPAMPAGILALQMEGSANDGVQFPAKKRGSTASLGEKRPLAAGSQRKGSHGSLANPNPRRGSQNSLQGDQRRGSEGGKQSFSRNKVAPAEGVEGANAQATQGVRRPSKEEVDANAALVKMKKEYEAKMKELSGRYTGLLKDYKTQNNEMEELKQRSSVTSSASHNDEEDDAFDTNGLQKAGFTESESLWDNLISNMSNDESFGWVQGAEGDAAFTSSSIVQWLMDNVPDVTSREAALELAQGLMAIGAICRQDGGTDFVDDGTTPFRFHWQEQQEEFQAQTSEGSTMAAGDVDTLSQMNEVSGFMYDEGELNTADRPDLLDDYAGQGVSSDDKLLVAIGHDEDINQVKAAVMECGIESEVTAPWFCVT